MLLSFYFYACYQKPKIFSLFLGFDQISPGTVSPAATGCFPSRCHTRQVRASGYSVIRIKTSALLRYRYLPESCHTRQVRAWLFRDPDQDICIPKIHARVDPDQDICTPKMLVRVGRSESENPQPYIYPGVLLPRVGPAILN